MQDPSCSSICRFVERQSQHGLVQGARLGLALLNVALVPGQLGQACVHVADGPPGCVRAQLELHEELTLLTPPLGFVEDVTHSTHQLHRVRNSLVLYAPKPCDDAGGQAARDAAFAYAHGQAMVRRVWRQVYAIKNRRGGAIYTGRHEPAQHPYQGSTASICPLETDWRRLAATWSAPTLTHPEAASFPEADLRPFKHSD
eukprot:6199967-Pleurochrysis_carterae.AAC.2